MQGGTEELGERASAPPNMIANIERGRGSGGRMGQLPGFGKILGNGDKEPAGGRGGISALGSAFANLRGINSAVMTSADQKVRSKIKNILMLLIGK